MESNTVLSLSENAFSWRLKQGLELKSEQFIAVLQFLCAFFYTHWCKKKYLFLKAGTFLLFLSLNNPMNISRLSIIQQQPWHPSSVMHGLHLPFLLRMLSPVGSQM